MQQRVASVVRGRTFVKHQGEKELGKNKITTRKDQSEYR
jgi:hypothetical protein